MSSEKILIVEDDPVVMNVLSSQLGSQEYQVTSAATIAEAMAVLRTLAPDLMILDLTLLDTDPFGGLSDGLAFLAVLRRSYPEASFPVIIHTVDDSPSVARRAKACGVFAIFKKGCPIAELLGAVRQALAQRQAQAAA